MTAFAGVHKGFAPPTADIGSKPEESINYELGAHITPANKYSLSTVLFYNDYENLQGTPLNAAGDASDILNEGAVRAIGIELQGELDLLNTKTHQLGLQANYTLTDVVFQSDFDRVGEDTEEVVRKGDNMPYVAPHTVSVGINYRYRDFTLSLQQSYTSAMLTSVTAGSPEIDPLFNIDLNLEYRLKKYLSFYGQLLNVTGQQALVSIRPHGYRPNLRRSFLIGFRYTM